MIFANLFAITSNPQYVEDVKELVLNLLEDEQLEVRMSITRSCSFDREFWSLWRRSCVIQIFICGPKHISWLVKSDRLVFHSAFKPIND